VACDRANIGVGVIDLDRHSQIAAIAHTHDDSIKKFVYFVIQACTQVDAVVEVAFACDRVNAKTGRRCDDAQPGRRVDLVIFHRRNQTNRHVIASEIVSQS